MFDVQPTIRSLGFMPENENASLVSALKKIPHLILHKDAEADLMQIPVEWGVRRHLVRIGTVKADMPTVGVEDFFAKQSRHGWTGNIYPADLCFLAKEFLVQSMTGFSFRLPSIARWFLLWQEGDKFNLDPHPSEYAETNFPGVAVFEAGEQIAYGNASIPGTPPRIAKKGILWA
jgi:hypothetical protein